MAVRYSSFFKGLTLDFSEFEATSETVERSGQVPLTNFPFLAWCKTTLRDVAIPCDRVSILCRLWCRKATLRDVIFP